MPIVSRRASLLGAASAALLLAAGGRPVYAQASVAPASVAPAAAPPPAGPFVLPPLPYGFDANEPSIDAATMQIHHDRHHAAYVANLNGAVKDFPQLASLSVETLLGRLDEVPEAIRTVVRNNAGGHANHSMFWQVMGGKGGTPTGPLADAIEREFGGMAAMQTQFNQAGVRQFGSGWVFVTVNRDGKLALQARPNQDSPLMDGGRVLFGNDVWEHAYYLKYQNRRPDYLAAWWNVVDWTRLSARYEQARTGTLTL